MIKKLLYNYPHNTCLGLLQSPLVTVYHKVSYHFLGTPQEKSAYV